MTHAELEAGTAAVRVAIDASGYGRWVSQDQCRDLAAAVLQAAENVRAANAKEATKKE